MPSNLENISEQFKGMDMGSLIAGPLLATCDAQVKLAKSAAQFIDEVGLRTEGDSKVARTVDFSMTRPNTQEDGTIVEEKVDLSVPMLAIVNTPNLLVDEATVTFDMEIKSSFASKESTDMEASLDAQAKVGWGPISASVKIHGSVATHKENTRSSDNSAKYSVCVKAKQAGTPEGLMKVLDMMATACEPKKITTSGGDAKPA